jgi:hypothetical protein
VPAGATARRLGPPLALLAIATVYLASWPRDLVSDEGLYLYEAKRILAGDVIYRDFFEIITPLSFWMMALCFRLFGASLTTARVVAGVIQAAIALVICACCRMLGVRRGLALAAGLAQLALAHPVLFIASPHWLGALVIMLVLRVCLSRPWARRAAGAAVPGVLVGLLAAVQQQKAPVIAVGVVSVLVVDALIDRRFGIATGGLPRRLAALAAGCVAVVVPLTALMIAPAGVASVLDALVTFPFRDYHAAAANRTAWGLYAHIPGHFFLPSAIVGWLPLALPAVAATCAADALRRRDAARVRGEATTTLLALSALLSILYKPDSTHLAVVAPVILVLWGALLERVAEGIAPASAGRRWLGALPTLVLVAALLVQLVENVERERGLVAGSRDTPFGRVDFRNAEDIALLDALDAELGQGPRPPLFSYPNYATLYLVTGMANPTPYEVLLPGYNRPDQIEHAIALLEARRVPYVVVALPLSLPWREDPLVAYLTPRYYRVPYGGRRGIRGLTLFRRRSEPASPIREGDRRAAPRDGRGRAA